MLLHKDNSSTKGQTQGTIVTAECLEEKHLTGILDRSIDSVIIPNYFSSTECLAIAEKIKKSKYFSPYPDYPSVSRFGQELFECSNEADLAKQHENAIVLVQEMRKKLHPYISPIDKLRIELDDIWNQGCSLAKLDNKKVFAGMVREFRGENPSIPHCDVIGWDFLWHKEMPSITNQLAANIYLKTSKSGGEILLWDKWPTQSEYNAVRSEEAASSFGLDRQKLGQPQLEIRPNQGDLILFNSMRVHAVKKIESGIRMTCGCFIGYSGEHAPLAVWT